MRDQPAEADDYDHPWKEVIEHFLDPFLAFFFPAAHAAIDWARGYTFLDTELRQITRDAALTGRHVDKLVQVWKRNGVETWLLIHIEIQSQYDSTFPERMFVYYYRIYDRYRRPVESLAILGDERITWRPDHFQPDVVWETALHFRFRSVKLLDYQPWDVLVASTNPFATVVMAHLKTLATKHDAETRLHWKFTLVRRLYEQGLERAEVIRLFAFLDWLMWLPDTLTHQFWQTLHTYEEEHQMTYMTSIERLGRAEGRAEGRTEERQTLIQRQLTRRCGDLPPDTRTRIQALSMDQLAALADALLDFQGLDDLHAWLQQQSTTQA